MRQIVVDVDNIAIAGKLLNVRDPGAWQADILAIFDRLGLETVRGHVPPTWTDGPFHSLHRADPDFDRVNSAVGDVIAKHRSNNRLTEEEQEAARAEIAKRGRAILARVAKNPVPDDNPEYQSLLALMAAEAGRGSPVVRIAKTSGRPVFTDATPASRMNPEGVALSRDLRLARRQMAAAGLGAAGLGTVN